MVADYSFRYARVVERHLFVRGGPDATIQFGLRRLLALGYDWCGLIENDIVFLPGWFSALKQVIEQAAAEGVAAGAVSIRSYEDRGLELRGGYSINWATGAGMVVFHREAARQIVEQYDELEYTLQQMDAFYQSHLGVSLERTIFYRNSSDKHRVFTMDWGFAPLLYRHGWATVSSVPSLAYDLEFDVREWHGTRYLLSRDSGRGVRLG